MNSYSLFQGEIIATERQYVDNLLSLKALDLNFNQTWASLSIFSNEGPHHFRGESCEIVKNMLQSNLVQWILGWRNVCLSKGEKEWNSDL